MFIISSNTYGQQQQQLTFQATVQVPIPNSPPAQTWHYQAFGSFQNLASGAKVHLKLRKTVTTPGTGGQTGTNEGQSMIWQAGDAVMPGFPNGGMQQGILHQTGILRNGLNGTWNGGVIAAAYVKQPNTVYHMRIEVLHPQTGGRIHLHNVNGSEWIPVPAP